MANTVTTTSIVDGESVGTMHVYLKSDGGTGDITDEVLLDSSALAGAKSIKKILRVSGALIGFSATLRFKETADIGVLSLPADECFDFNLQETGTINNPEGTGSTGDLVATTAGFSTATDTGTIIIKYKK